ncbi:hypothetical protein KTH_03460 [Thermosporothrix hazakensis]|uniref:Uncharacterized protein n=1 Tax=Thermosporothrix sp. COM3 TaxID=2490863 RepID=A0A455SFH3_9CHLR|nr:hypothetical protein KTC_08490 [Thermosporothrix sp. COM3]GCE45477.1 hypothetical protein KTH_03460 [Thermosporothrix hazakensis]
MYSQKDGSRGPRKANVCQRVPGKGQAAYNKKVANNSGHNRDTGASDERVSDKRIGEYVKHARFVPVYLCPYHNSRKEYVAQER